MNLNAHAHFWCWTLHAQWVCVVVEDCAECFILLNQKCQYACRCVFICVCAHFCVCARACALVCVLVGVNIACVRTFILHIWMSHVWMSHGTNIYEPCDTYECVMGHIWSIYVVHVHASCDTYEWVMSYIWLSLSHICMSHTCDMSHLYVIYDVTHSYMWHYSFICVTWLIRICDMTHPYMWHDSSIHVPWLIHMRDVTHSYMQHDLNICVTWLVYKCRYNHQKIKVALRLQVHDSFIYVTWHIHIYDISYMWHYSFICVTRQIHICDMTDPYNCYDSCIGVGRVMPLQMQRDFAVLCCSVLQYVAVYVAVYIFMCCICCFAISKEQSCAASVVSWHIHMCDTTHSYICDMTCSYVWHDAFTYMTRLCGLTGS